MTRFVSLLVLGAVCALGCSKEEKKEEPPAAAAVADPAKAGLGTVQVQANGTTVKAGQGTVQVQAQGQPGTQAQIQAGGNGQPVVMQNGTNQMKVETNKVEAKTGDGRTAVVTNETVKMQGADGKTVEVKTGSINANGVKIEGNKIIVPGVGTVQNTAK